MQEISHRKSINVRVWKCHNVIQCRLGQLTGCTGRTWLWKLSHCNTHPRRYIQTRNLASLVFIKRMGFLRGWRASWNTKDFQQKKSFSPKASIERKSECSLAEYPGQSIGPPNRVQIVPLWSNLLYCPSIDQRHSWSWRKRFSSHAGACMAVQAFPRMHRHSRRG